MNIPLTPETGVNIFTVGEQVIPQIATLLDGSFVVVWQSAGQDGDLEGIFGQHYSAQGQRIGAEFVINSTHLDIQADPAVAATDDGGFVVVWEARNQDQPGTFDFGVFGQRFSATATPVGSEFQVNAVNVSATQFDPAVAGLPGGGFVVTFRDDFGDNSSDGIRARIYDAAGVPAAVDFQVNSTTSGNQVTPQIARIEPDASANNLVNGGFVITWSGTGDGSSNAVFAQVFQIDGTPVGTEFIVNTTTTSASS